MFWAAAVGSQAASILPVFPAEYPTAKQHRTWTEVTVNMIKSADDPAHVSESSVIPEGRGKYKPRSLAVDDPKSWIIHLVKPAPSRYRRAPTTRRSPKTG